MCEDWQPKKPNASNCTSASKQSRGKGEQGMEIAKHTEHVSRTRRKGETVGTGRCRSVPIRTDPERPTMYRVGGEGDYSCNSSNLYESKATRLSRGRTNNDERVGGSTKENSVVLEQR